VAYRISIFCIIFKVKKDYKFFNFIVSSRSSRKSIENTIPYTFEQKSAPFFLIHVGIVNNFYLREFIKIKAYMITGIQLLTKSSQYLISTLNSTLRRIYSEHGYFVRMFDANRLSISRFLSTRAVPS